jgi:HTH-type transcriptional regulator/antitoxin HigA
MAITAKDLGKGDWEFNPDDLDAARQASPLLRKLLPVISSQSDYEMAVGILDKLLEEVRGDDSHELAPYLHLLGTLISEYEQRHFPLEDVEPVEVLRYLIETHGLTQSDLPEIGNQAKVSEILSGKRQLNARHIQALSQRFNLSPAVFFPKSRIHQASSQSE